VVEAAKRSGSLITAHLASEQGRDVFAIPGSLFNEYSEGANLLIQEGATPILSALDILREYEGLYGDTLDVSKLEKTTEPTIKKELTPEPVRQEDEKAIVLPDDLREIYDVITKEPVHVSVLAEKTGKPVHFILVLLTQLEIKGLVVPGYGQTYSRTK